jgi:hypothetical protein
MILRCCYYFQHFFGRDKKLLEIANQKQQEEIEYLRNERTQFIEKENISSIKLSEYQTLLETLNGQLHAEIDKISDQSKKILTLKNQIIQTSELRTQYRNIEDLNNKIQSQLSHTEDKLSKSKTFNNTLIDKQLETQQKLVLERGNNRKQNETIKNLKIAIENYDIQIKKLEKVLASEQEQHIISKDAVDKLIDELNTSDEPIDDRYQDILLSQLKEKNVEIQQLQNKNNKFNDIIKQKDKDFNDLKHKVSSLF